MIGQSFLPPGNLHYIYYTPSSEMLLAVFPRKKGMTCYPFLVQPPPPASLPIWLWKSSSSMRHSTLMLDSLLAERIFLPQNKCYKWMDRTSWRLLGKWSETGHVMNPKIFHLFICNHVINANYPKNLIIELFQWFLHLLPSKAALRHRIF